MPPLTHMFNFLLCAALFLSASPLLLRAAFSQGTSFLQTTAKDGRKFFFAADGRLESMRDPQGNVLAIIRDGAGRIQRVTHSSGKEITFVRNADGFITDMLTNHLYEPCQPRKNLMARVSFLEFRAVRLMAGTSSLVIRQNVATHGPTPSSAVPAKHKAAGTGSLLIREHKGSPLSGRGEKAGQATRLTRDMLANRLKLSQRTGEYVMRQPQLMSCQFTPKKKSCPRSLRSSCGQLLWADCLGFASALERSGRNDRAKLLTINTTQCQITHSMNCLRCAQPIEGGVRSKALQSC